MKKFSELFEPKGVGEKKFFKLHNPQLVIKDDPKNKKANDDAFSADNVKVFDRQKFRFGAPPEHDTNEK